MHKVKSQACNTEIIVLQAWLFCLIYLSLFIIFIVEFLE